MTARNGEMIRYVSHAPPLSNGLKVVMYALVLAWCLVTGSYAHASWAGMTLSELADASDIVAVGEVVDVSPAPSALDGGRGLDIATLAVTEPLTGSRAGDRVKVLFPSERARIKSSVDISYKVGQKGIWFLRKRAGVPEVKDEQVYLADHPQRFMGLEALGSIREFMKKRVPAR